MARSLRPIDVFPITTRVLEVLRVADVTPGMRRVTLGGEQLAAHTAENGFPVAAFRSEGFDDEFKLILKHPDTETVVGPTQNDGVLNWPRDDDHLLFRTYTARRWDPVAGELDVDLVTHGVGSGTTWARRVQPGEQVQIAGPKSSSPHPVGVDWTLVAGDETALPAIGRWLEEWPAGARGKVFIEVGEPGHRQDLPVPDGVELTWLSRDGAEPGSTTLLFDAIRDTDWWDGRVFAWVAGESLTLIPIRRWLCGEKSLPKEQVEVTGYWRRQEVAVSEADASLPDLDADDDEGRFHELSEIVPGFVLRVAATVGLGMAFNGEPRTLEELAAATGCERAGLGKLLRYLEAIDIVERDDTGRYALTSMGRELEDDDIADALHLEGTHAARELGGMLSLRAAVQTGTGDHARWFGSDYEARVQSDQAALRARVEDEADSATYFAGALASSPALDGLESLVIAGNGAGGYAEAIVRTRESASVTVVAPPSEIEEIDAVHAPHERITLQPGSLLEQRAAPVDGFLITGLGSYPDADAIYVLRQAAASLRFEGRVLVFGEVLDAELADEHDYEHDLIEFALTGGGARTHDEHIALFTAAGLGNAERITIGWGETLYKLTPREWLPLPEGVGPLTAGRS